MKKLMIAAAVAAISAGAYATDCQPDTPDTEAAQAYKFKLSGKTTVGAAGKVTVNGGGVCTPATTNAACVLRVPGKVKIEGWMLACDNVCTTLADSTGFTEYAFWATKPEKASITDGAIAFETLQVMGKKSKDAEAIGTFTGTLFEIEAQTIEVTLAGQGKFDQKTGLYKSLSGNFAGKMSPSYYVTSTGCVPTTVFMCDDLSTCVPDQDTAAFGTWSLKYSKSDAKKYLRNGRTPSTPRWYEDAE